MQLDFKPESESESNQMRDFMKKLIISVLIAMLTVSVFAFEKNYNFTTLPKTDFEDEPVYNGPKFGAADGEADGQKNKKDVALPDQKLMRGFERFQKVDAFGDPIPDSFLYHRNLLSADHKGVYDEVYKAIMNFEPSVTLISRVKKDDLFTVMYSVYYDNPEMFWWACNYRYWWNSDTVITKIEFTYLFEKEKMQDVYDQFLSMSFPIVFYAALLDNDIDKVKYIHDYLCKSIVYDYDAFNSGNYGGKLQTAYSAICEYKTVCAGYSRAFAYYCQQLGIPCVVLSGSGHAWNIITLDGNTYQMDVTWDDGNVLPPYFNLSHDSMQNIKSHTPCDIAAKVIKANPYKSDKFGYKNCFGITPIGKPYTYKEFKNIQEDMMNPLFAEIYIQK